MAVNFSRHLPTLPDGPSLRAGPGRRTDRACLDARAGVSQPAVSKHLGAEGRQLVRFRREGRETHYSAQPQAWAVRRLDEHYGAFWRDRFDRLENLLKGMDK